MLKRQQKTIFFRLFFGKSAFLLYLCTRDGLSNKAIPTQTEADAPRKRRIFN